MSNLLLLMADFYGTLAISVFLLASLGYRNPHPNWLKAERYVLLAGAVLAVYAYYQMTVDRILTAAILFFLSFLLALPFIMLNRSRPNNLAQFLKRACMAFGYILLTSLYTTLPLGEIMYANLIRIMPSGMHGYQWGTILLWTFDSYPVLFVLGALASWIAYTQKQKYYAVLFILAPLIPVCAFALMWLIIGINFLATQQFQAV